MEQNIVKKKWELEDYIHYGAVAGFMLGTILVEKTWLLFGKNNLGLTSLALLAFALIPILPVLYLVLYK